MALMKRIARAQAEAAAAHVPTLHVSTRPLPGDVRVTIHVQPGAALGMVDVALGLGQGSKGRGLRVGDDPAVHAAVLYRLAAHVAQYARDFAGAAAACEPSWPERLTAASALLDPTPTPAAPADHCRVCGAAGTLAHDLCPECYDQHEPF